MTINIGWGKTVLKILTMYNKLRLTSKQYMPLYGLK